MERDKGQVLKKAKIKELEKGLRPDGKQIGLYRNPSYARYKNILNPQAGLGNVDLILTGAFANSLFPVRQSRSTFIFDASNSKAGDLFAKYGNENRGLATDTFEDIQRDYIAPELVQYIKEVMNGR